MAESPLYSHVDGFFALRRGFACGGQANNGKQLGKSAPINLHVRSSSESHTTPGMLAQVPQESMSSDQLWANPAKIMA